MAKRTILLRYRNAWLWLHRWIGLILLLGFAILGLTGSALVWPSATEKLVYPDRFVSESQTANVSFKRYLDAGAQALGEGERISAIRLPAKPGDAILVGGMPIKSDRLGPAPRKRVWLNPQTAQPTQVAGTEADFMWYMRALHGHFGMHGPGRDLVGIAGILMVISSVSGLWLWWPPMGRFLRAFKWKRSQSFLGNLHYQTGIYMAVPLLILGLTGAWIVWPVAFGSAASLMAGEAAGQQVGRQEEVEPPLYLPLESPTLTPEQAIERAQTALGGGSFQFLAWPTQGKAARWIVTLSCVPVQLQCSKTVAVEDAGNGKVLQPPTPEVTTAAAATQIAEQLHAGDVLGPIWKIIVFVAGILPTVLAITGLVMWLRARGQRKKIAQKRRTNRHLAA